MKKSKKTISILIAISMVMAMTVSAFAADPALAGDATAHDSVMFDAENEQITTQADSLSAEMFDFDKIMSRPVTEYAEPTYVEGMHTPSDMLSSTENGVMSLASNDDPGAYFYAYGPMGTTYVGSFVNVKLPTSINTLNGTRAAFISLGIHGSLKGIDIGMRNTGTGWIPCSYDVYAGGSGTPTEQKESFKLFVDYTFPSTATNVIMMASPLNTTHIRVYMQGYNSAGNMVGKEFYQDIPIKSGNLVAVGNKVQCQHYRFVSMVPNIGVTTSLTDGTYMKNGALTNCQLYDENETYVNWGWNNIKTVVSQSTAYDEDKMDLTHSEYHDYFSIIYR